jgi:hypothetical protein
MVEAAVTVAVAVLMTVAGFEMLQGSAPSTGRHAAPDAHRSVSAAHEAARIGVAMPHVDEHVA